MSFEIFSWNLSVLISLNNLFVSKNKYALDLLQKIGMSTCKLVDTLIEKGLKLYVESNHILADKERY
jgi:hypothetical protein